MNVTDSTQQQDQAVEKYRSFVAGQFSGGQDAAAVVQRLAQMGVEQGEAARIVQAVQTELGPIAVSAGQTLVPTAIPMAIAGGLCGAVAGGILWGLIVKATDLEIGYMAVGVGLLCGLGVELFTCGKRGVPYQVVATACSVFGIVLGKYASAYFVLQAIVAKERPELLPKLSFFSGKFLSLATHVIKDTAHPLDILWIILAIVAANRLTRIR